MEYIYTPAILILIISCGFLYKKKGKEISLISRFILAKIFKKKICDHSISGTNIMRIPIGENFVTIPFDKTKEFDTSIITVHGIDNDGKTHNLTHLPGVPYSFSANDLSLKRIIVSNVATLDTKDFIGDEIVGYADGI